MKVLIAEDDPVVALGLTERVRSLGHDPIGPVGDGEQAVAEAKASLPDLYLFDIEMPYLDGLAAAVQLAGEGFRRPVVIVTGVDDPSLVERSIAGSLCFGAFDGQRQIGRPPDRPGSAGSAMGCHFQW